MKSCDVCAPLKYVKVKNTYVSFITPEIRENMHHRDFLHRKATSFKDPSLWKAYQQQRNKVNIDFQKCKRDYLTSSVIKSEGNQRQMWRMLKTALNRNTNCSQLPSVLSPNCLNDFFTTIGPKLTTTLPEQFEMPEFTSATSGSCYKFAPITENQVFQEIKLLGSWRKEQSGYFKY